MSSSVFYLQGLGKLANKFPNIAGTCINYLQDFLVSPSPILLKLHRQQSDFLTPHQGNLTVKGSCPLSQQWSITV